MAKHNANPNIKHINAIEGLIIGKRSSDWLKIKVAHTADFEVIGCVPTRSEKAVRALLLGARVQGRLVYKGKVGSGLTRQQRKDFMAELAKVPKLQEPVDCPSGSICRLPGWRCRVRDCADTSFTNIIYTILPAFQSRKKFDESRLKFKGTSGNIIR